MITITSETVQEPSSSRPAVSTEDLLTARRRNDDYTVKNNTPRRNGGMVRGHAKAQAQLSTPEDPRKSDDSPLRF
ncbi:hypothetical protein PGT21_009227 [Puccinia graminis f. sp. tritici]|uniref:Uncharacterized protein n=1 Tax=Puccinia graminis f. sp. tritici TaxID=56615 RepID=A0A5B0MCE9_PUCGR|nr:hypothetical protein PGT21_009227 [Puccinia graminis f. sp. tritici]